MCAPVHRDTHHGTCAEVSLQWCPSTMGSGDLTQSLSLCDKCFYPQATISRGLPAGCSALAEEVLEGASDSARDLAASVSSHLNGILSTPHIERGQDTASRVWGT